MQGKGTALQDFFFLSRSPHQSYSDSEFSPIVRSSRRQVPLHSVALFSSAFRRAARSSIPGFMIPSDKAKMIAAPSRRTRPF